MRRELTVDPKAVKASNNIKGNQVRIRTLKKLLQSAFDKLESLDADSYEAVGGDSMWDDLDINIRQCDTVLNSYGGY